MLDAARRWLHVRGGRLRRALGDESERGASLVEFALVAVVLFVILFGIVDFGLAFRDRLTVNNAGSLGGRLASRAGQSPDSDWLILQQVLDGIGLASSDDDLVAVEIYESQPDGSPVGGSVNTYWYDSAAPGCNWDPCPDPASPPIAYGGPWTPDVRDVTLPGLDRIGVRVWYQHDWIFDGLLPVSDVSCARPILSGCWQDTSVFRLEPQDFES